MQSQSLASCQLSKSEVKVAQSCLTLCDPMDCIDHVILQARILEWVAIPFSNISENMYINKFVKRTGGLEQRRG